MIINIRGTNGAGKTTLVRQLMAEYCATPLLGGDGKIAGYDLGEFGKVVGRYETACGGCDTIKTQADTKQRILEYTHPERHVVFEGILVSTIYGPWLEFSRANGGMLWAFLDTPLDLCLKRVYERNGGKTVKTEQIEGKYFTMQRIRQRALEAGETVADINHQYPLLSLETVLHHLRQKVAA